MPIDKISLVRLDKTKHLSQMTDLREEDVS